MSNNKSPRWWVLVAGVGFLVKVISGAHIYGKLTRRSSFVEGLANSHFPLGDGRAYLALSQTGYAAGHRFCAFYPLFPLLIRWTTPLAGGNPLLAGLVLSNAASVAGWALFYTRVRRRWGAAAAGWALAFLVSFPGALFYQFVHTESLFFLLLMLLWWGLEERRRGWVWGAAFLLPLTRAIGVFAVLPIAWYAAQQSGLLERVGDWCRRQLRCRTVQRGTNLAAGEKGTAEAGEGAADSGRPAEPRCGAAGMKAPAQRRPTGPAEGGAGGRRWPWTLLAAPVVGWGVYLGLMAAWTGNPFEGFAAQRHWGVHSVGNLVNLPKFVVGFFTPTHWHEFRGSLLDRGVFVLVLYLLPVLWRLDKGLLVWTYWLGVLPAMSGTFTSYTRYAACAFPVFVGLGVYFAGAARGTVRGWGRWVLVGVFGGLHLVLLWRQVNFRWAG